MHQQLVHQLKSSDPGVPQSLVFYFSSLFDDGITELAHVLHLKKLLHSDGAQYDPKQAVQPNSTDCHTVAKLFEAERREGGSRW